MAAGKRRKTKGSLAPYYAKRAFDRTPEPRGRLGAGNGRSFVVQKHGARRLHYDFRLEWNGTLKSWAVPKGPSLDPRDKRLAVRVEDHPVEYGDFEGVIPEGEYGAGAVIVWDRGTWQPEGDPDKADAKGHLNFTLEGEKLHGAWSLVRLTPRGGNRRDDRKNWLLIKRDDTSAKPGAKALVEAKPDSVASGRSLDEVRVKSRHVWHSNKKAKSGPAKAEPKPNRAGKSDSAMPDFVRPQLATRTAKPPAGGDWLHEVKFDGYRIQARIEHGKAKLLTRTGLDWTRRFRSLAAELEALPANSAIIDGEVVALDDDGLSDFGRLQDALSREATDELHYYVFDLLWRDGIDLRETPLVERKRALAKLVASVRARGHIRFSEHFEVEGGQFFREVCHLAMEGAISKRAKAPYVSGRGSSWLKSKCLEREEMIVVGFTPGTTGPRTIGSLLLAQHAGGKLVYAGRVGTGFTRQTARTLRRKLDAIASDAPALEIPRIARKDAQWVKPVLVAEIEFVGWTADRIVRHAAYKGLREDKPAPDVLRDEVASVTRKPPRAATRKAAADDEKRLAVLTHPDRVLYDEQGVTKRGLAEYLLEAEDLMLPHVRERPLSLVRCPEGTSGACFYQKSIPTGTPDAVYLVHNQARGKRESYPAIRDVGGLIGLAQMGTLEIHVWGCKADKIMMPDRIVFDLDPGEGVAWKDVIAAAFEVRERLLKLGLESFIKTTGGKGLHVAAPIAPKLPWDTVKDFTKAIASSMAHDAPDRYVATMAKKARAGKIFVDYLRNGYGATAVAAYSPRARPTAPISMPLEWKELVPAIRSDHFHIDTAAARFSALKRDPWAPLLKLRQSITAKMLKAMGVSR